MKELLIFVNGVALLGILCAMPIVQNAEHAATWSTILELESNGVLNANALALRLPLTGQGVRDTPEHRLAILLQHNRATQTLLLTAALVLLSINAVCMAIFWKKSETQSSNQEHP